LDRTDPGWRLAEIEAAREEVPEEENSARVVVAAVKLLPRGWPTEVFKDLFGDLDPAEQLAPEDFARLTKELDVLQPALEVARKLKSMRRGRHRLIYAPNPMDTLLPDQQDARRIVNLLAFDALRHEHEQDLKAAVFSCRAMLNSARSLGDEPFSISQLVRIAGVSLACRSLERTLAQGEAPPDELALMQRALSEEDSFPDMLIAARGERGTLDGIFTAIENGAVSMSKLAGEPPEWYDFVPNWFGRESMREAHPAMLEAMSRFIDVAKLPMHEQAAAERELDGELRAQKRVNPLVVLFIPALQKVAQASRRKHAYLRCMIAALAAEHYRQKHKRWPHSLDQLCPEFLAAVPLDPFDGEPLRYRRVEEGMVIYSVGADAVDNHGNIDHEHPHDPGVDLGYRLWDTSKRRKPAQPEPVAPQPK
jgi:hypothetical protein